MNRGDLWELIFLDEKDRQRFLDALGEARIKTDWTHVSNLLSPLAVELHR